MLLLLAINFCACAVQQPPPAIGEFANATTAVTAQTQNVYQVVQNQYTQAEVESIAADFETRGFNPDRLKPFIPAEVLQVRTAVLKALSDYAQALAAFASDKQLTAFDDQTKALGQQLLGLNKQAPIPGNAESAADLELFATSVDALGRLFIEYQRAAGIKQIVEAQDGNVRNICTLLAAEIGGSAPAAGVPMSGLRNQLWNEYTQAITGYSLFVDKSLRRMTASEQFNAINQLARMVEDQAAADAMLAATAKALIDLANTHSKLKAALDNSKAKFRASLIQLLADVKSANDFYSRLSAKPQ